MNQKKAKALRKLAKSIAIQEDVPFESAYSASNIQTKVIPNLLGEDFQYESSTYELHNCLKVMVNVLKREYRSNLINSKGGK